MNQGEPLASRLSGVKLPALWVPPRHFCFLPSCLKTPIWKRWGDTGRLCRLFFLVKTNLKLWCNMMNVFRRPAAGAGEDMRCSIHLSKKTSMTSMISMSAMVQQQLLSLLQETSMWWFQTFFYHFFILTPTWRKVEMIQIQIFTIAIFFKWVETTRQT